MSDSSEPIIYQLKIVLLGISPMIWRRILVSSDSTIEDLHYTLQLAMGWSDIHLHHFIIHGKQYGITQPGGTVFSDCASEVELGPFGLRLKEKFFYEYDFSICPSMGTWRYWWRHQIRVEAILTPDENQIYPICTGGKGVCPPENCGGPWGFMKAREEFLIWDVLERFASMLRDGNFDMDKEEASELLTWLLVYQNRFDHPQVNKHLRQYATGDRKLLLFEQRIV
ncbi:plasmid pRiA4b ORF-3 family protein [Chroococcidiopsis sp. FACHB-1243]|uniref:plasmid pRiA4b ORF-3 family protein n=1 Tax=Chroococcidiopsis sp. [FACHB-1243] TaxID=2692781 RepID=UPI001783949A|nr:plasmid pRiA4b ORF-3 family protein [Chroococcidiopsis sp. [FACHB-1243]]MBD2309934.1 plasmid pRiA4b ORF-3 family protein [Chroococcidiopsis sp. [FACHB-1243]]